MDNTFTRLAERDIWENRPLSHIDPNHATRLAYLLHTAGDPGRTNAALTPLAQREIDTLYALQQRFEPLSHNGVFMSTMVSTIIGIAQDITRRKREYLAEIDAADREYDVIHQRYVASTNWTIVVRAGWTVAKDLLLGAIGLLVSQLLAPYIPHAVAHQTGTRAPSALLTFLTLVVGGWVGYKSNEFSRASMEGTRNWRKQEARIKYDRGRLLAFRQNWSELVAAWETYTGQTYGAVAFFELVIEDDFKSEMDYVANLRAHQRSLVMALCGHARRACNVAAVAIARRRHKGVGI